MAEVEVKNKVADTYLFHYLFCNIMEEKVNITRQIAPDIHWVGVNDRRLQRFENMFPLPQGVAYNSYLITGEKTILLDTVDSSVRDQFIENVAYVLGNRSLDYLVINHMEPDHCGNIEAIVRSYPNVKVIGNAKTFQFFSQYYAMDLSNHAIEVSDGQLLDFGSHKLRFYFAPMVHWPEVMFCVEERNGILFSADAFGSFGTLPGALFSDELDFDTLFLAETRRYYSNIVGRFGSQVHSVLQKLPLDTITMIAPLHGPLHRKEYVSRVLELHKTWSLYAPEQKGVVLAYASMYQNTEQAVEALAFKLGELGVKEMRIYDVSNTHPSYIIADIFKYSHLVLGAPTYNMNLYLPMEALLKELQVLNLQNRHVAIIANHSWASVAKKGLNQLVGAMKNITMIEPQLDIRSTLKRNQMEQLDSLAQAIADSLNSPDAP